MLEGMPPTTRLRIAAFALGWLNFVSSPAPMEKSCQWIMPRLPVWLMVIPPDPSVIVMPPTVTVPPFGLAWSWTVKAASPATKAGSTETWPKKDFIVRMGVIGFVIVRFTERHPERFKRASRPITNSLQRFSARKKLSWSKWLLAGSQTSHNHLFRRNI